MMLGEYLCSFKVSKVYSSHATLGTWLLMPLAEYGYSSDATDQRCPYKGRRMFDLKNRAKELKRKRRKRF